MSQELPAQVSPSGPPWEEVKRLALWHLDIERRGIEDNEEILRDVLDKGREFAHTASFRLFFAKHSAWECPGCNRDKRQIMRPDRHGKIMLSIVEHHDHAEDGARTYFRAELAKRYDDPEPHRRWFARMVEAFRRFAPRVVCQDCNSIDIDAKKFVGAPKFFSFSPDEISRLRVLDGQGIPRADRELALAAARDLGQSP